MRSSRAANLRRRTGSIEMRTLLLCSHSLGGEQPRPRRSFFHYFAHKSTSAYCSRAQSTDPCLATVTTALLETNCPTLKLVARGKVRDIYDVPNHPEALLFVATDRVSAFDVIMKNVSLLHGVPLP